MYPVSQEFDKAIQQPGRYVASRMTIDGQVYTDEQIQSIDINDSICPGSDFEIGTAVMAEATVKLLNYNGTLTGKMFENKEAYIELGVRLEDSTYEYVPMGYFTFDKAEKEGKELLVLKGLDRMSWFEKPYVSNLVYPRTLLQIATDICNKAGIVMYGLSWPNNSVSVANKPVLEGVTLRKAIAQIAELAGGFAKINRDGELQIFNLRNASASIDDSLYITKSEAELNRSTIDKVIIKLGSEEASAGTGVNPIYIVDNMFCQNPSLFTSGVYGVLNGLTYLPYNIQWIGNPAIEVGDKITLEGHPTLVTSRSLSFRGGIRENYSAVAMSNTEKNSTGKGSMTIEIKNQKSEIIVMKDQISQVVTETNALEGRIDTAETQISQNAQQIILKASQSSVDALGNRVTTAESSITQQANQIALKVNTTDFSSLIEQNASNVKIAIGQVGGENLIRNGDISNGTLHWSKSSSNGSLEAYISDTLKTSVIRIVSENTELASATQYGIIVTPGKTYTLTFDCVFTSSTRMVRLAIRADDSSGTEILSSEVTKSTSWRTRSFTFTIPSGISRVYLRIVNYGKISSSDSTSYFSWVNAVIVEGDLSSAWLPHKSELKGANYIFDTESFKIGNSNSVAEHTPEYSKWVHSDGSYTKAGTDGFERWIAATGNKYRSLVYIGQGSADFNAGESDKQVTLNLPSEFKGKDFDVMLAPSNILIGATGEKRIERFRTYIVNRSNQVDRVNAIIYPYIGLMIRNGSGAYIGGTITFNYIVVA